MTMPVPNTLLRLHACSYAYDALQVQAVQLQLFEQRALAEGVGQSPHSTGMLQFVTKVTPCVPHVCNLQAGRRMDKSGGTSPHMVARVCRRACEQDMRMS